MGAPDVEPEERQFRLLVESVRDYAIFMLDRNGLVTTWNPGAERIKGYRADEIIGMSFSRFYPAAEVAAGKCEMALEVATREGRFEQEGWRIRKDGTQFWANVVITPLRHESGMLVGFAKITRDLTERRALEHERLRSARAEEAVRLRDEFLAIASHELRTPLTSLLLPLEALEARFAALDPSLASRLARSRRSGRRLASLIDRLLDVTRIASGELAIVREHVDVSGMLALLVDDLLPAATAAGCELVVDVVPGLIARWDRVRIEQVLSNLFDNAIKLGRGNPIELGMMVKDEIVTFIVADRGPGIPEADRERIFDRFQRGTSIRHYGGLGLGLFITRQIVEAHGGTVSAHNREGGGAELVVRLPLARTDDAKTEPAA